MNRRGFLGAILLAGVAPAIVRADSLMRVIPRETGLMLDGVPLEFTGVGHPVIEIEYLSGPTWEITQYPGPVMAFCDQEALAQLVGMVTPDAEGIVHLGDARGTCVKFDPLCPPARVYVRKQRPTA